MRKRTLNLQVHLEMISCLMGGDTFVRCNIPPQIVFVVLLKIRISGALTGWFLNVPHSRRN